MESKFKIIITISIIALLIIILASFLIGYLIKISKQPEVNKNQNININQNVNVNGGGYLPFPQDRFPINQSNGTVEITPKERKLFADYYQPNEIRFSPQVPQYQLPLNIKTDVLNYRDLSRKIDLDAVEDELESQGFVVITYPLSGNKQNFESVYKTLNQQVIPIFVTADSVTHLNQLQLNTIFKEIEQEVFYHTAWQVSKRLYDLAKFRFDQRRQGLTIASDLLIEASRLETAFFATALELLKPKPYQIKDEGISVGLEKKFFSPQEGRQYNFELPESIKDQVNKEVELIKNHNREAKSPLFLYPKDYQVFKPDSAYQSSEKLKNYSLAAKFYSEYLFPLYEKNDSCPDCLLDIDDQRITLVAASLIAQDFNNDKEARNLWLKIYKTLSFFQGLEYDFTYLHYLDALINTFGPDFDVEQIFDPSNPEFEANVAKLQEKLETYSLLEIEGSQKEKAKKGLKLLRAKFPTEDFLFSKLTTPKVGNYLGNPEDKNTWPLTLCHNKEKDYYSRCLPRTLDVLSLINSDTAAEIINLERDNLYQGYNENVNRLKQEIERFDQYTWFGTLYWATLKTLESALTSFKQNFPTFMQSELWQKKEVNTALASRFNLRKKYLIKLQTQEEEISKISTSLIDYGYVEPIPAYYNTLLAVNKMLKNALIDLEIVSVADPIIYRLENNIELLTKLRDISIKELENQNLDPEEIVFIDEFYKQYRLLVGDLDSTVKSVNFTDSTYTSSETKRTLKESLENLNLLLIIYKNPNDELILAAGPVFNYYEFIDTKTLAPWQKEFIKE